MSSTRLLGVATTAALPLAAAACVFSASVLKPDPVDGQGGASGAGGADAATSAASGSTGDAGTGGSDVATSSSSSGAGGTTSSSSSGASGTTSSSSGSGGDATDGCANLADEAILVDNNAMLQAAQDCGFTCGGGGTCASACMVMNKKISVACGDCWGDFIACAVANCASPCGFNPTGLNCKNCTATNNCDSAYHMCSGV